MNGIFEKARGMQFPRNVLIGHGILKEIVPLCDELNFLSNGMIIAGKNTYASAGKEIDDCLSDSGYNIFTHLTGTATVANVDKAIEMAKETHSKFILAVGGGSKIDIGKLVAADLHIPFISIAIVQSIEASFVSISLILVVFLIFFMIKNTSEFCCF